PRRVLGQRARLPARDDTQAPAAAAGHHPDEPPSATMPRGAPAACIEPLPVGSQGERAGGWWGVLTLIVTEAGLFGYLLFCYFYLQSQSSAPWPPEGMPKIGLAAANTVLLLSSSVFVWLAERALRGGNRPRAVAMLVVALVLGTAFALVQLHEWRGRPYGPTAHLYGSLYFTITGFHLAHVVAGLAILALLAGWTAAGFFGRERRVALTVGGLYWHFVDFVWLFIFTALYVSPHWLRSPG
ncbi:cytochrome c oxidase subunit 3, partial [Burkholderia cenocepacia]